jgi:DNA-binding Lrp family transcriptional regulator
VAERVAVLSSEEKALLTIVQASLPLEPRPFLTLGERVGLDERVVIALLSRLKASRTIRKIGPVFEPAALGLATELGAAQVAPEHLDAVGKTVAAWPEVTHCYTREHEVNLWYAGVAGNEAWFAEAGERIRAMTGVTGVWRLPTLRRFKIRVQFDLGDRVSGLGSRVSASPLRGGGRPEPAPPTADNAALVALLQRDLPLVPEPFAALAEGSRWSAEELLAALRQWVDDGRIRRYGALVNHRRLGFTANAMVVMSVPAERIEEVGELLSSSPSVSHCYERPPFGGFPHNLYAMVHGRSREECLDTAAALICEAAVDSWQALFSTHEYGKSSPDYAALLARREV